MIAGGSERASPAFSINELTAGDAMRQLALQHILLRINRILSNSRNAVRKGLEKLRYLGSFRAYPPRRLTESHEYEPDWLASGGSDWDIIREDPKVRKAVNKWFTSVSSLQTPYEVELRRRYDIKDLKERATGIPDKARVSERYLDTISKGLDHTEELSLIELKTGTRVSFRDIGVGVSQVLPVLVEAYGAKKSLIVVEQPEIHLHPALQSELADVFIESALGDRKNTFIIETHSEHLMLRFLRRIRETSSGGVEPGRVPLSPNDIQVVYVQPTSNGSLVHDLPVTEDGEFAARWPQGFFTERARELF